MDSSSYLAEDTIVSRVSGVGGAISVLRLSGPIALETLVGLSAQSVTFSHRSLNRVRLRTREGRLLDDAMAVFFQGPSSFTGEDVVEIFLHGGGYVTGAVIQELLDRGCRQALPGEFSFRAVRNGKMSVDQAQAVHDLISANNGTAHSLALDRLSGGQAAAFIEIAELLRRALTLAEAGIDFSDQDLEELELGRLKAAVKSALSRLVSIASSIDRGRRIQEGIALVLAGLPNAGKSSLFNELLGQSRSLISEEAGTTRDVIRELMRLRGPSSSDEATFIVHDTAGLRDGGGHVERMGIDLTRGAVADADLVLFVVEPNSNEREVLQEWAQLGKPREKTILVLSKADLLKAVETNSEDAALERWKRVLQVADGAQVSSQDHTGLRELNELLLMRSREWLDRRPSEVILTHHEQVDAVQRAVVCLKRALEVQEHDAFAADLRQALEHLSFFIGVTTVDDVLGRIFSQFCIGK